MRGSAADAVPIIITDASLAEVGVGGGYGRRVSEEGV